MTSLEEAGVELAGNHRTDRDIKHWAKCYTKEVEEHIYAWYKPTGRPDDFENGVSETLREVLNFLKGETASSIHNPTPEAEKP